MSVQIQTVSIVASVLMSGILIACASASDTGEPTQGPALWRLSDADTTIYLYGLPNVMDADADWRSEAFESALSESDGVLLEADRISPEARAELAQTASQIGVYHDGRTLTGVLDEATLSQAVRVSEALGIPLQALDPVKPWLAANQLQSVMLQRAGLLHPQTPMSVIASHASEAGKPIAYFEEPTTLLVETGNLPEESQLRMFGQALDILENDTGMPQRNFALWISGDVDGLSESYHGEGEWADEVVRSVMLLERNEVWQSRLEDMLESQTGVYFAAVGVGHLVGDDSLVAKLDTVGYSIVRE